MRSPLHYFAASGANLLPPLAAIVTAPLLAQGLGVTGRGESAAAVAPLMLAVAACGFGIPEALTHFTARRIRHLRRTALVMLFALVIVGLGGSLLIWGASETLAAGSPQVGTLIRLSTLALAPALLTYGLRSLAAGMHRWRLIFIERTASSLLRLAAVLALAATGTMTTSSATLAIAITSFAGGVVYVALLSRTDHGPDPWAADEAQGTSYRRIALFSSRIWIGTLTGILLARLDQVLFLPLSTSAQLGLYAVAVNVCEVSLIVNNGVRDVMFSRVSAEGFDARAVARASRLSTLATSVLAVALALGSIVALPVFFGREFAAAIPVTWVLLLAAVVGNPGSIAGAGLSGHGRPGLRSISLSAGLVANVIALALLVPGYGAIGAAVATLVGNAVAGYGNIALLTRFVGARAVDFLGFRMSDLSSLRGLLRQPATR